MLTCFSAGGNTRIEAPVIYVPIRHLYICRESSTNQLLFMQNKPNLLDAQMNVNSLITTDYKNFIPLAGQKNKPKQSQNKPNLRKAKMIVNLTLTKDYRKNDDFLVRINKPNLVRRRRMPKMNANLYVTKDYENETAFRPRKNKPKTNPISERPKSLAGKSGHTPSKAFLHIILIFRAVVHILKRFLQGEVK